MTPYSFGVRQVCHMIHRVNRLIIASSHHRMLHTVVRLGSSHPPCGKTESQHAITMRSGTHTSHHGIGWSYLFCISCIAVSAVAIDSSAVIDDPSTVLVRESLGGLCLMDLLIVSALAGLDHTFKFRLLMWVIVLSVNSRCSVGWPRVAAGLSTDTTTITTYWF